MCLTISETDNQRKIAKEDIPCYKVMYKSMSGNFLFSLYRYAPYVQHEIATTELGFPDQVDFRAWEITDGLHSFVDYQHAKSHMDQGISSIRPRNSEPRLCEMFCYNAIIPKGAEYYEGRFNGGGSYASNQLIITEEFDFFHTDTYLG